jgi:AraC-like DNA-binding protein
MSNPRQTTQHQSADHAMVRAVSIGFSSGYHWERHGSAWGVLVWASLGVITVTVNAMVWVVPPHQAVWIPAGLNHAVRLTGRGTLRQVYLAEPEAHGLPAAACVMQVSALVRELLRRICVLGVMHAQIDAHGRLLADGASVTHTALAIGYDSTSAFVSAFRKATGVTPGRYAEATERTAGMR